MTKREKKGLAFLMGAQDNFSGPETFPQNFWELLKLRIWQQVIVFRIGVSWPPGRARVGKAPAG